MGKLFGRQTYGVVFGGGGARGGTYVGAGRVLNEGGYKADLAIGASIGALVAASLGMDSFDSPSQQLRKMTSI